MSQCKPQVFGRHPLQNSGEILSCTDGCNLFTCSRCPCAICCPFFVLKISVQRILLAVCERAAETTNSYERHRILLMYHLFVNLLLREVKDGLGGAWAFVLRDIIYTLIHHINRLVRACTHTHTP